MVLFKPRVMNLKVSCEPILKPTVENNIPFLFRNDEKKSGDCLLVLAQQMIYPFMGKEVSPTSLGLIIVQSAQFNHQGFIVFGRVSPFDLMLF